MRGWTEASLTLVVAAAGTGLAPHRAEAFGHLWEFTEVFSNADGTIQFIEMFSDAPDETALSLMFVRSGGNLQEFHFPGDVVGSTLNRRLLVATAGFASLPGAVTPDFVMPDSFIRISGDTLSFWSEGSGLPYPVPELLWDSFAFGGGTPLPTDGMRSLVRDHGSTLITAAVNSPSNYSGQTGMLVPEPASGSLLAAGLLALASIRTRRSARQAA
jgi:hypothetical protein